MKQLSATQITILHILGDGLCHKGTELGKALGITRSAIWKQINHLIDMGIPILRKGQLGYQLTSELILLDKQEINNQLNNSGFASDYSLTIFSSIDSTNLYLKNLPATPTVDICCAELQTQGKGRFGRLWHSPFGENIYCSSRWNVHCDLAQLSGLSLVTSLATLATINQLMPNLGIQVKWPNDLLWNDKKLCGSLIEINIESNSHAQVIIGIGLNINTDTKNQPLADKPWCSLFEITQQKWDRNTIIASLLVNLEQYMRLFTAQGLNPFINEWKQYDYLAGKYITVTQALSTISGIAEGINQAGLLVLADQQGVRHYLSSGDTSVRAR